jgi:hypothetical protein
LAQMKLFDPERIHRFLQLDGNQACVRRAPWCETARAVMGCACAPARRGRCPLALNTAPVSMRFAGEAQRRKCPEVCAGDLLQAKPAPSALMMQSMTVG